jgi:hypothetical protein
MVAGAGSEAKVRRASSGEIAKLLLLSIALAGYVYLAGWFVTAIRLAAARLPVDAALPVIDNKVLFAAGLRLVLAMTIVFGAMCLVAYLVHAWTWNKRAPEWHSIVNSSRAEARDKAELAPLGEKLKGVQLHRPTLARPSLAAVMPQSAPENLEQAKVGDPFVRVVAGFNVGVLAVVVGLAGGRLIKTVIDQICPGQWWALLGPWLLISLLTALVLAHVRPVRGTGVMHGLGWIGIVLVALFCSAPIGLLVLTWAAIATFGRQFGTERTLPKTKLDFVLSPLPWILLAIYTLVGLALAAMPPVSFSQTTIQTAAGTRYGGYLARSPGGVYIVSCIPLADATSTREGVAFVPGAEIKNLSSGNASYAVDSGYRPSLPTLALHAFGVDAQWPAWIRPELHSRRATCAGAPQPRPSGGTEQPQLGGAVFAGPAPPGGRAHDGEPPIAATSPKVAELARRFQPTVLVTAADRFWPVSVGAVLEDRGRSGGYTCLRRVPKQCTVAHPSLSQLTARESAPGEFLEYPAKPALDPHPTGQLDVFLRGQLGLQTPVPQLHRWLADPGVLDPWSTAQVYFYYAGEAHPAKWPKSNPEIEKEGNKAGGLLALQYWFFYPYNYYPTLVTTDLMNGAPIAADLVNTDLHQGDWEHVTVLINRSGQPLWLYMARHSDEGEYFRWSDPRLSFDEGHPVVQAAFGGHPTYDAHCGQRLRFAHGLKGLTSDWVVCGSGRFAFRAMSTPLVDIAKTPWACWQGHFGVANAKEVAAAKLPESSPQRVSEKYYHVAGPRSPLWQAENGHLASDGKPTTNTGVCAAGRNPEAPERAAISSGIAAVGAQVRP